LVFWFTHLLAFATMALGVSSGGGGGGGSQSFEDTFSLRSYTTTFLASENAYSGDIQAACTKLHRS
jgi:hypothetical protein